MTYPSHKSGQATSDWFVSAVKSHPEGLLLLAAGCALLLRSGKSSAQSHYPGNAVNRERPGSSHSSSGRQESMASGMADSVSQTAESARGYASDLGKTVSDKASAYASTVGDYAQEARRNVTDQSERLVEQARSTMQSTISRVLQEQPLALAVAGLAAGAAVAAAFPTTSVERQTLGPAGEKISEAASSVGHNLSQAASKAGAKLMDIADERGLNNEGLKEAASDVAGAFGEAFKGNENRTGSQSSGSAASSGQSSSGSSPQSFGQPSSSTSDKAFKPGTTKQS